MKSVFFEAIFLLCALGSTSAYLVDPPTTAPADTVQDCSAWHIAKDDDNCNRIASAHRLSVYQIARYNPSLKSTCIATPGVSYCIERNFDPSQ